MMKKFLLFGVSILFSLLCGLTTSSAAFLSSLDIGSPPSLLEIGADYVLLEITPHANAKGYKVFYSDKPFRGDEKTYVSVEGKNVVVVPKLQAGIRYYFTAVAFDGNGNESESFSPSVSLMIARPGESALLDYTNPFKAELNVTEPVAVVNNGDGTATITWAEVENATYYKLYVAEGQKVDRTFHPFVKVYNSSSAVLGNLLSDHTYHFGVVAVDGSGYESTVVSPDAVANFGGGSAGAVDSSLALTLPPTSIFVDQYSRTIRWEVVPQAASYMVWKSRYPFEDAMYSSPFLVTETTKNTFWSVSADPEEPIFYIAVQAIGADGAKGPLSAPVKVIFPHDGKRRHLGTLFQDVDESSWYASALVYLLHEGVVSKNTERRFKPGDNITRAAFSKMLLELRRLPLVDGLSYGNQAFCDVDYRAWYGTYVATMTSYRFTQGYPGGRCAFGRDFRPATNVSRAEALRFLFQAFQIDPRSLVAGNPSEFVDVNTGDWYYADVVFASRINLVSGYVRDGKKYYDPHRTITRAEAAQLMYKFITQLDYQYHEDNTNYLYERYDTRYRQALTVPGKPTVELVDADSVRISWSMVNGAEFYRVLVTPDKQLDKTTRNLAVLSVDENVGLETGGKVAVTLPRSQFPGDHYTVSVIAFDDELNESSDYSVTASIELEPLPNAEVLESRLFVPEAQMEEDAPAADVEVEDAVTRDETVTEALEIDQDCAYVGMFEDQTAEGYTAYVQKCTASYVVGSMDECLLLGSRSEQIQCLMLQGYKQRSSTACASLNIDDTQACRLGMSMAVSSVTDCSRMTILPQDRCLFYVRTADALLNNRQSSCDGLSANNRLLCLKTYVHGKFTPAQCTAYVSSNAAMVEKKDPTATAVAESCRLFHEEVLTPVQSLEDQRRQTDLQFLASVFVKYGNQIGTFPGSVGECLDGASLARKKLVERGLIDDTRFPVDPVTTGNAALCRGKGGVYYYKSLDVSGQVDEGFALISEMEQGSTEVPLFTVDEVMKLRDYNQWKTLMDARSKETNPTDARLYVHLGT